jgi:hypothetical protein
MEKELSRSCLVSNMLRLDIETCLLCGRVMFMSSTPHLSLRAITDLYDGPTESNTPVSRRGAAISLSSDDA